MKRSGLILRMAIEKAQGRTRKVQGRTKEGARKDQEVPR